MITINLLPWREKKREQEKKQFTIYLGIGFVTAVIIVFLINYYASSLVENQTQRNDRLKDEITKLDKQIASISQLKKIRQSLIARMTIVQNLQATRVLTVRLFDELIQIMPRGIYLYYIERSGDKITVKGFSQSNSDISQMMRNIEASSWIQDPNLVEIKKNMEGKNINEKKLSDENEFNLSFILKPKDLYNIK